MRRRQEINKSRDVKNAVVSAVRTVMHLFLATLLSEMRKEDEAANRVKKRLHLTALLPALKLLDAL